MLEFQMANPTALGRYVGSKWALRCTVVSAAEGSLHRWDLCSGQVCTKVRRH